MSGPMAQVGGVHAAGGSGGFTGFVPPSQRVFGSATPTLTAANRFPLPPATKTTLMAPAIAQAQPSPGFAGMAGGPFLSQSEG